MTVPSESVMRSLQDLNLDALLESHPVIHFQLLVPSYLAGLWINFGEIASWLQSVVNVLLI